MGAVGLAWCVAGAAALVALAGEGPVLGLARADVAAALLVAAGALLVTSWAVERSRAGFDAGASAVVLWAVSLALLGGAFAHRDEILVGVGGAPGLAFAPLEPLAASGGTVEITRRVDGHFVVPARVDDRVVAFVFDTGATAVVLSAETADRLGIARDTLRFRVPVSTANGRALAAPVTLDRLSVGPITVRRVPALVTQPGLLEGNLLGQTFLDRLESYEVRGRRLVLRAKA